MFANYLYSCFVPFRHSQRLVEWAALAGRQSCYKVQAEVTSAGRHIIYVISVLNYLHRKYGRLTSASTATVGDVLRAVASSGFGHAELSVSPIVRPDSYDVFFLILLFFHRFGFRFFSAYSSFSDFFVIVAALGSVAANDMLKWPKRFILPILCRLLASVLLHYYFCLSCSVLFHFSLRLALQFFDFALSSSFRHLFRLFSGAFAGN